ncbi:GSCFA domain-containing protein [Maribacter cobaltidurans]|uniref:GSCFA domain-containing protein n=2 Tax=Maribacter cobaltidurans TaxID=1178778 RepID=A0A223VBM9_9FLAO|nr:GSCFA domain-containing protein [Maribacter cobaltidurans]
MKLQTQISLEPASGQIDYSSRILLLGSCFSENIGKKLEYYKFQTFQNPFGILFHPLAIENLVQRTIEGKAYQQDEIFERDGIWRCFDAHSELSSGFKEELLKGLNDAIFHTAKALKESSHIIITLGTSWVYEHKERNAIVANCHKVPQKDFAKKLLSPAEIELSLQNVMALIQKVNPNAQIIFTISPVRHIKDGFVENQRSKAHLITAIHSVLSSRAQSKELAYFPSYEILMDELRDYRFYEKDMVHPNELAVDYIWEKFSKVFISEASLETMQEVKSIRQGMAHRPFIPDSEKHQLFLKNLKNRIKELQKKLPFIDFS